MSAKALPTGTLTFLFTDVEGSSWLWEQAPDEMMRALVRHDEIIDGHVSACGGYIHRPRGEGDSRFVVFTQATNAVSAAVLIQQQLCMEPWQTPKPLKVRMALHTGEADLHMGDYYGAAVNRCARIRALAHGSQTLISRITAELAEAELPAQVTLRDMGLCRLRDLSQPEHIFQLVIEGMPDAFPPLQSVDRRFNNLPVQFTDFVGREKEFAVANRLLSQGRLVTIVGPGGTGKTRLAIQIAEDTASGYRNGICFASLAPITSGEAVLQTVAESLEMPLSGEGDDLLKRLLAYLRPKQLLLILDNFEHVLGGVSLVSEILRGCPEVTLLCTSRVRLNLSGESVLPLAGLAITDVDSVESAMKTGAVQLFVQSAKRVQPEFELSPSELRSLQSILRIVEGIPLGIILAAAWVDMLSITEIADEVSQSLDLLESELSDIPQRHRSIRAVFDYSWNQLSEDEQELFQMCSVFRGGFTREAAYQVIGASLRSLAGLSHKSLLIWDTESGRFQIHGLLLQYAVEKLDAAPQSKSAVSAAHAAYFVDFTQVRSADFAEGNRHKTSSDSLAEIGQELANIREAWQWAIAQRDLDMLERGQAGLGYYYLLAGPMREGEMMFRAADDSLKDSDQGLDPRTSSLRSRLLAFQAQFLNGQGNYDEAIKVARLAITFAAAAEVPEAEAMGYLQWSRALWFQGHYQESYRQGMEALELTERARLPAIKANSLRHLGTIYWPWGDYEKAIDYFQQALTLYRQIGDQNGEATTLNNLGIIAVETEAIGQARSFLEEAATINREVGAHRSNGRVLTNLAIVCWHQGDYQAAKFHNVEALENHREIGSRRGEAHNYKTTGMIFNDLGLYEGARANFEQALAILRDIGAVRDQILVLIPASLLFDRLGDCERSLLYGRQALRLGQEVGARKSQADALTCIGHALAAVDRPAAEEAYQEALNIRHSLNQAKLAAEARAGLARLAQTQGDHPEALRQVERILELLETSDLEGTFEPYRVYLTCYRVLTGANDSRAEKLLETAHRRLQAQAGMIDDPRLRNSFLEKVAVNAKIVAARRRV